MARLTTLADLQKAGVVNDFMAGFAADLREVGGNYNAFANKYDPSLISWYQSQTQGKTNEQVIDTATKAISAANPTAGRGVTFGVSSDPNSPAEVAYRQRLAAMGTSGGSAGVVTPPPITTDSIQAGLKALTDRITKEGITDATGKVLLPPNAINTQTGQFDMSKATINANTLGGSSTPLPIASSNASSTGADSTAAGAEASAKSIADYIKLLTPPESSTSKTVKDLIEKTTKDMETLNGRGDAQLEAEKAQQVEQKKQTLQNYQTELNTALAEYKQAQAKYATLSQEQEGKAVTMSSIIGSQAQINKMALADLNSRAANISLVQANVASAQGNLSLAQSQADRAVDLRYQDALDSIKIRQEQLSMLENELNKEEKIRANAIQMYLEDQATLVAEQKASAKQQMSFNLDAMQRFPSASINVNDSYDVTQQKILGSREYQFEVAKDQAALASTEALTSQRTGGGV